MKTRIIKRRGKYYVQVKSRWWHLWGCADMWWGDYGPIYNLDGAYCCDMFRGYRFYKSWSYDHSYNTLEEAQEAQEKVIKQGYLYSPKQIGFTITDRSL